jgi:hypothetical protein
VPDISMCRGELDGETCPLRDTCFRYFAKPNPDRQAYLIPEAVGEDCDAYWGPVRRTLAANCGTPLSLQHTCAIEGATG